LSSFIFSPRFHFHIRPFGVKEVSIFLSFHIIYRPIVTPDLPSLA
jgi:hypothetical protein